MRKLLKIVFALLIIAAAGSWLTSVAYGHDTDTIQLEGNALPGLEVTAAPPATAPSATFYGNAIGSVNPGDLFYIDAADVAQDFSVNIYITNTDRLVHFLGYINLEIAVYKETAPGQWEKAAMEDGTALPRTLITLNNGMAAFDLPGMAQYKVVIESGCFKTHRAPASSEDVAPSFYLEAEPR